MTMMMVMIMIMMMMSMMDGMTMRMSRKHAGDDACMRTTMMRTTMMRM